MNEYELKILKEIGFSELMIKKVYSNIKPNSLEDAIKFMSRNINDIYQHKFYKDKDNKCFYCEKEPEYHIDYNENINKEKIIDNKLKDKINLNDDYIIDTINEGKIGDKVEIDEETKKELITKGENATCKIIVKNKYGEITFGSGFFCKIPYLNKTIKVLFTNKHVLNEESIKLGNKIELIYQNKRKFIKITNDRFCRMSTLYDFTCIEILDKDNIIDFYEIEDNNNKINNYDNEDIAIIQYPKGKQMEVKTGHLKKIVNYIIYHTVDTDNGSSGSPIILLLRKYKIIGIHCSSHENQIVNIGSYIKNIIECINKNEIICCYDVTKYNIGKKIRIINYKEKNDLEKYC